VPCQLSAKRVPTEQFQGFSSSKLYWELLVAWVAMQDITAQELEPLIQSSVELDFTQQLEQDLAQLVKSVIIVMVRLQLKTTC
jgi:hypothetical protein